MQPIRIVVSSPNTNFSGNNAGFQPFVNTNSNDFSSFPAFSPSNNSSVSNDEIGKLLRIRSELQQVLSQLNQTGGFVNSDQSSLDNDDDADDNTLQDLASNNNPIVLNDDDDNDNIGNDSNDQSVTPQDVQQIIQQALQNGQPVTITINPNQNQTQNPFSQVSHHHRRHHHHFNQQQLQQLKQQLQQQFETTF